MICIIYIFRYYLCIYFWLWSQQITFYVFVYQVFIIGCSHNFLFMMTALYLMIENWEVFIKFCAKLTKTRRAYEKSPLFVKVVLEHSSQVKTCHILDTRQPWLSLHLCVYIVFDNSIRMAHGSTQWPIQTNAFFFFFPPSFGASANMMRPCVMLNVTLWLPLKKLDSPYPNTSKKWSE